MSNRVGSKSTRSIVDLLAETDEAAKRMMMKSNECRLLELKIEKVCGLHRSLFHPTTMENPRTLFQLLCQIVRSPSL